MRGLVFHGVRDVRCERVADPGIVLPGDALVRVELAAICGSDLHVWHGRERGLDPGTVLGHEFVGQVVATGSEVQTVRIGDRVVAPFSTSCGACFSCREGLTSRCEAGELFGWVEQGRGLPGAQAELVRVPLAESTLLPAPPGLTPEAALLLGDVLATGHYCALRAEVARGGSCAVLGCGPVGLMAVLSALELGAGQVFAVDAVSERLERARALGAEVLEPGDDLVDRLRAATEGRGVDAVLEAVGNAAAHRSALDLVRAGGTISVVGVHNEQRFPFTPAELYARNVTYRVGRCPARHLMESLMPLARRREPDLLALFTHRLPLERGPQAYEIFDAKRDGCLKVALQP